MRRLILIIIFFIPFPHGVFAQFTWSDVTCHKSINLIKCLNNEIWGFTTGGIFKVSLENGSIEKFTTLDGLSSHECLTAVFTDTVIRVGMSDGTLNVYDKNEAKWRVVNIDPGRIKINDMVIYNDILYIASNLGISEFLLSKNEIKSTFRNLGNFEINTEVNTLFIHSDTLWAGTNEGIAYADIKSPNLQDPQFWRNFTKRDGMPDVNINYLYIFEGKLYCASNIDILSFNGTSWEREWVGYGRYVYIKVIGGQLYVCGEKGVFYKDTSGTWKRFGSEISSITSIEKEDTGGFWASSSVNGLYKLDVVLEEWIPYDINSPGGNTFAETVRDLNGVFWAVSGGFESKGIYTFSNGKWENYTRNNGLISSNFFSVAVDKMNRKWFGTPGEGAMIISDEDGLSITTIDTANGYLAGSDMPDFVVVGDIRVDDEGNVWLINNFANTGKALVVITPEFDFHYFSISDGLSSTELNVLEFDSDGNVWIGTSRRGIDVLHYNGTFEDKSDDQWEHITTSGGLNSGRIRALKTDKSGIVWIGTEEGVQYWFNGKIYSQYGLIDDYINCIEVDAVNNKWFGTNRGISVLRRDNASWIHFTAENSPLADNQVLSIMALDNGIVYAGTAKGLSIIETPFIKPDNTSSDLNFFPNPFIVGDGGDELTIKNLLLDTTIKIFTISGNLVRVLNGSSGEIIGTTGYWDGKDKNGELVSTGVYIIAAFTDRGNRKLGKLAVVRR